ncbi:hypothetical protein OROGR_027169 [Orobanche gracilis]
MNNDDVGSDSDSDSQNATGMEVDPIPDTGLNVSVEGADPDPDPDPDVEVSQPHKPSGSDISQPQKTVATAGSSFVWEHFMPIVVLGQKKNKCKHCSKILSDRKKGTTTHLARHLKEACPARHKLFPKPDPSTERTGKSVQSQLYGVVLSEGDSSVQPFSFSFDKVKTLAAHMILAHEYSFNMVEHKVFNEFLRAYSPYYRKISRFMVRKECFAVFDRERERIKGTLSKVARVGLTTDCWWSGVQRIGYMVITCHYVDRNWNLQKRVISFVNVPPPHNGVALAKEIHRVANFYGIGDKVASVTVC